MPDQQTPLPAPTIPTVMRAITPKPPMSAPMNALPEFKEICFPEYHPGKERVSIAFLCPPPSFRPGDST